VNVSAKLAVHSFSRSSDNSDCSFGVGLRTPNLGKGRRGGHRGSVDGLWATKSEGVYG